MTVLPHIIHLDARVTHSVKQDGHTRAWQEHRCPVFLTCAVSDMHTQHTWSILSMCFYHSKERRMDEIEASAIPIISCFAAVAAAAADISRTVAGHAGRPVSSIDIVAGLIYRLQTPMTNLENQKYGDLAGHFMKGNADESDNLTDAEPDHDGTGSDQDVGSASPEFSDDLDYAETDLTVLTYSCPCHICRGVTACIAAHSSYVPEDPQGHLFLNAIRHTCAAHHITMGGK